jgi:DNA polymerase III delta prime subunit
MAHHAFVIEAEAGQGIETAHAWILRELQMKPKGNPDVVVLQYELFSVSDARRVSELAAGAPFAGESKVLVITASRAYHEAQNALLKIFEEPPAGTYLFLVLPTLGGLLPTLRSRVSILSASARNSSTAETADAKAFIQSSKEKRSAIIKKLTSGKDEEQRRANREEAIALLAGIEAIAYAARKRGENKSVTALLFDIATLRAHLHDRSAPVRMILEHISLVLPKDLL